jgi:hypothetical protein
MDALSRDAAELAIGFRLGLVPQAEVISWADGTIAILNEPPLAVIDLALMGRSHPQDVLSKLMELSGGLAPIEALPHALGRYAERLRSRPEAGPVVAKGLWDIYVQSSSKVPPELAAIAGFDEDYWLARNEGYGTQRDVYAELLAFFERFELSSRGHR